MIKKHWCQIISPKAFGSVVLGKALVSDNKRMINKVVKINLSELTKDFSKFYIKVSFKVEKMENDNAISKFVGHECLREYLSHIVRPGVTRVDNNVVVNTKDGHKIRVKGLLLFSKRVNRSVKNKAILTMDKVIKDIASKKGFYDFIKAMLFGDLCKEIKERCKKLYPISKTEIRKSEVLA